MPLAQKIAAAFRNKGTFTMPEVYAANPDTAKPTLRARIYENLGINFERIERGIYQTINPATNETLVLLEQDGRDLSILNNGSIDSIITDHPWNDTKANKGGNRNFATYDCFSYTQEDFNEKARVLKDGAFCVEIIPAETATNFEYLYQLKKMAQEAGLEYYAKVAWKKGTFVSNTGRKAKNTQDVLFFTKGRPRQLRLDAKKTKATGVEHRMSGATAMLPTNFDVQAVARSQKMHQAEMPVTLFEQIIELVTLPGEIILDQFAGSGASGEAALNMGRNAILIELVAENIAKIRERFAGNPALVAL